MLKKILMTYFTNNYKEFIDQVQRITDTVV